MNACSLALLVTTTLCPAISHAGEALATDFTRAEIERMVALGPVDHQGKVVDVGKLNIGISVVTRTAINKAPDAPVEGLVDTQLTKVYTIVAGSGTLTTGGKLVGGKPVPAAGTASVGYRSTAPRR